MKKTLKAAAAALVVASLFTFAACTFEKGEAPEAVGTSLAPSQDPTVPEKKPTNPTGDEYSVVYLGNEVMTLSEDEFNLFTSKLTEGTDYTISGKTITMTMAGISKLGTIFGDE